MRRMLASARPNWETTVVQRDGLVFSPTPLPGGGTMSYWREGAYYELTAAEVELLEQTAATLFKMCDAAGDHIARHPELMRRMGIPDWAIPQVVKTWWDKPACQSVYGRFDIRFGGLDHPDPEFRVPKLYEFNADTPTCLVESAVAQWRWHEDTAIGSDQWNAVYERLVDAWKRNLVLIAAKLGHEPIVWFACSSAETSGEDLMTTQLLRDACAEAGYITRTLLMEDIFLAKDRRFYSREEGGRLHHLDVVFKLYPWEYMVAEEFGRAAFTDMENIGKRAGGKYIGGTVWIEPPYKMLWSNKALLVVLWELFGHTDRAKYLIPTYWDGEQPGSWRDYVRKPLLGREGANVEIVQGGQRKLLVPGDYGTEGYVCQAYAPPPSLNSQHPVLGVWMIDGEPAGLGIRESKGVVTDNLSNFVPHVIGA